MADICSTRDSKSNPQIEKDSDFIAQSLKDGKSFTHRMFDEYQAAMQKADNYPAQDQPYLTHNALLMTALYCKDGKQDITLLSKVTDFKPGKEIDFHTDFWKSDMNEIYEEAKGRPMTPGLQAGADNALNHNIERPDIPRAAELFNKRAQAENQPMEVVIDPNNGNLHLQPKTITVSNKP